MITLTKIYLITLLIVISTGIAKFFNILDQKYGDYIIIIGLIALLFELIILLIFVMSRYKTLKILKNGVEIIRYRFDDKCIKGNTDILPKYITTTNPRKPSIFKIYVEVKDFKDYPDFGICKIGSEKNSMEKEKHILGAGAGIIENLFIFHADIIVRPNERVNFKFTKDENVKTFFVGELYVP